jgi:hypothetical protein
MQSGPCIAYRPVEEEEGDVPAREIKLVRTMDFGIDSKIAMLYLTDDTNDLHQIQSMTDEPCRRKDFLH